MKSDRKEKARGETNQVLTKLADFQFQQALHVSSVQ